MQKMGCFFLVFFSFLLGEEDFRYSSLIAQGNKFVESKRMDKALPLFQEAMKLHPEKPEAYLNLFHFYYESGFYDLSQFYLDKALMHENNFSLPEDRIDLYLGMALNYAQKENFLKEEESIKKIQEIAENNINSNFYRTAYSKAMFLLGILYFRHDDIPKTVEFLEKSIGYGYKTKLSYLFLTDIYRKKYESDPSRDNRNSFVYYYRLFNGAVYSNKDDTDNSFIEDQFPNMTNKNREFYQIIEKELFKEAL